jgi:adenylosuccinate lyase
MATENIMMAAVAAGADRQNLHERIRRHSQAAARRVKLEGGDNDVLDRLRSDPAFAKVNLSRATDPRNFIGRAPQQVDEFIRDFVTPIRRRYKGDLARDAVLSV